MDLFPKGSRVRVRQDPLFGPGPWPAEPVGTVVSERRNVETVDGSEPMIWVKFDEPQRDTDGDGPYDSAEVLARYLEPLHHEQS